MAIATPIFWFIMAPYLLRHLLGVANDLLSLRCINLYQWEYFPLPIGKIDENSTYAAFVLLQNEDMENSDCLFLAGHDHHRTALGHTSQSTVFEIQAFS